MSNNKPVDLSALYQEIYNANREYSRYDFDFKKSSIFSVEGNEVNPMEDVTLAFQHGVAMAAMEELGRAFNKASNEIGLLQSLVESSYLRKSRV